MMDGYTIKSNRESGLGRSVLQLLSAPYDGIAIIMELKVADTYAQLVEKAEEAPTAEKSNRQNQRMSDSGVSRAKQNIPIRQKESLLKR